VRNASCQHIVDLADVRYRVLAGGGFQAHRSAGGDQAVASVAAADLAVVPALGRGAGDGEAEDSAA
jgi:hypothetical protein